MFGWFKKKEIEVTNKDEFILTMTRIVELLHANKHAPQAFAVQEPLQYLIANDKNNFLKSLNTVDIWGGSGAAWEVGVFRTKKDEREFMECFIRLVELMKEIGVSHYAAKRVAILFREDLLKTE